MSALSKSLCNKLSVFHQNAKKIVFFYKQQYKHYHILYQQEVHRLQGSDAAAVQLQSLQQLHVR